MRARPALQRGLAGCAGALAFLLLPASVVWSSLGGAVFHLLAATGVALALTDPGAAWRRLRGMGALPVVLLLAIALNLGSVLVWDLRLRELNLTPLLFALPVAVAIGSIAQACGRITGAGAATACVLAFAVTLPEWPRADDDPTVGLLNAIVFAQLVLVCAAHALAALPETRDARGAGLLLCAVALGVLAITMSGTRGAIITTPVLAGLLWANRHRWQTLSAIGRAALVLCATAVLVAAASLALRAGLPERFARITEDAAAYRKGEVGAYSIATRLALWHASIEMIRERPWFGSGANRFKRELAQQQSAGRYPADAPLHAHPHNTLLSVLVQYGATGLALLLVALTLAWRGLARAPPVQRSLGRVLIVAWCLMSLSNDLLAHQNTLRVIAFQAVLLGVLSVRAARAASGPQSGQATIS